MASDGAVIFSTELDEGGLKSALNGLSQKAASWGKGAVTVLKGTGVALGAVTTGIGALAKQAIAYNSSMENYVTNFGVMLGDEAAAVEHVAQLREMAAKTPFGMTELANASQTMQSFGLDAEYSMAAMKQLGDISLGNKERFGALALAFSQVSSAGKLTGQDLLQMVNAGFNPLNTIAEKTGTNLGDLKDVMAGGKGSKDFQKAMKAAKKEVKKLGDQASDGAKMLAQIGEDGYISAEMVGKAMEIETSPGGRFYNGMEKASQTFSGMVSTLEDDAAALVGKIFEPMTQNLTGNLLPLAQNYLTRLGDAFETGGIDGLVNAFGVVLGDAISRTAESLPDVLTLASGLLTSIGDSLTANASTIMDGLTSALTAIATSGLPETTITTLGTLATTLLSSLATEMQTNAGTILSGITNGLVTLMESGFTGEAVKSLVGIATGLVSGIVAQLPEALPALAAGIIDGIGGLFESLPEMATAAKSMMSSLKTAILGSDEQKGVIDTLGDGLIEGLQGIFDTFVPNLSIHLPSFETIRSTIETEWESMKSQVEDILRATLKIDFGDENDPKKIAKKMLEARAGQGSAGAEENLFPDTGFGLLDWLQESIYKHNKKTETRWWDLLGISSAGAAELPADAQAQVDEMAQQTRAAFDQSLLKAFQEGQITYDQLIALAFPESGQTDVAAGSDGSGDGAADAMAVQFVAAFANGITSNASTAVNGMRRLLDTVKASADTGSFVTVGKQLATGVAMGIILGIPAVIQAIRKLIREAVAAAKAEAGIESPSKLFRDEVGSFIASGAAVGVEMNAYQLRDAVSGMVSRAVPNVSGIGSEMMLGGAYGAAQAVSGLNGFSQVNNFNVPVQTPDEFAQTMREYATYGLAAQG